MYIHIFTTTNVIYIIYTMYMYTTCTYLRARGSSAVETKTACKATKQRRF